MKLTVVSGYTIDVIRPTEPRVVDASAAAVPYSGEFAPDDPVTFARALRHDPDLIVQTCGNEILIRSRAKVVPLDSREQPAR